MQREIETTNETPKEVQPVYPPEKSMGGDNATYIGCEYHGSRRHYGVCLYTIKACEEDRLNDGFTDCQRAIGNRTCHAYKMREEERKAGQALYYQQRQIKVKTVESDKPVEMMPSGRVDKNSLSYKRGWNSVKGKPANDIPMGAYPKATVSALSKAKPAKKKSALERGMDSAGSMTDVINDAARSEKAKTKPKVSPAPETKSETKSETKPAASSDREERLRKARKAAELMRRR